MPASTKKPLSQFDSLKNLGTGTSVMESETKPKLGRPLKQGAKSRNNAYRAWGGYLKKKTLTEANYELAKDRELNEANDESEVASDMSELLEDLLSEWLAKRKQKQ